MAASLLASNVFTFADGSTGHACGLGSAPAVGDVDVLCVNSDTVVSPPTGFTAAVSAVNSQGAYIFYRMAVGGEAASVTVTTSGDHATQVAWSRWASLVALDTHTATQVNASIGTATPGHSTGTLAEAGELVVAFAALHSISTANQSAPSWSTGFTGLTEAKQGTDGPGVVGYVGYKIGAGTAAETPSVSWSGDGAFDRYTLTATFTTAAGPAPNGLGGRFLPFF